MEKVNYPGTLAEVFRHGVVSGQTVLDSGLSAISAPGFGGWLFIAGLLAVTYLLVRLYFPRSPDKDKFGLKAETRGPRRLAIVSATILLAFLFGWSWLAPLSSAALAPGVVSPEGARKTVQHLEGGIVSKILVVEGQKVRSGDPVLMMDDTMAVAEVEELENRRRYLVVLRARLLAERENAPVFILPAELEGSAGDDIREQLARQSSLLKSRLLLKESRSKILSARVQQLEEQIVGLAAAVESLDHQIEFIDTDISNSEKLFESGLERMPRILALKRERAEIEANRALSMADIAENRQAIGETKLQLLSLEEEWTERVDDELANVQRALDELMAQLPARRDKLARTIVRSPIDGTVMNIAVTTETGVVGAGQPLFDLVPEDAKLIVDARVKPTDIDRIRPNMRARVVLTAYRQRNLPFIYGTLGTISADAVEDKQDGTTYFLAKVEVDEQSLAELGDIRLVPGMPAEVLLLEEDRSLVSYLTDPVKASLARSFLEN